MLFRSLRQLEERTRDTIRELEELVERENQIRDQLGLEELASEGESSSDSEAESQVQTAETDTVGIAPSFSHTDRTLSFLAIQSELSYLQNSLLEVSGQYDGYINTIEEIKAAEAAEIARKENLRKNLVTSALRFVGNAYVYGGNDPYTGVDCSGFSRYILGHYAGIYLPRTAASQSTQGMPVSADEARPGDFCIGQVEGEDACAFILQRRDSQYWSGAAQGEAVYLHKFCVRPDFSHRGMTQSVVEALRALCRDQGIRYIRLDTGLDEKAVRKIYLRAGFKIVDIIDYDNGRSLALYELEV